MQARICRYCGSSSLKRKEIEIRHLNSTTLQLKQLQKVVELECDTCGWVGTEEQGAAAPLSMVLL